MTTTTAAPGQDSAQRQRILDVALELMSEHGAGTTSMRQLAKACDLNVAAIYYYFPSKADLLKSVIEERQYELQLSELPTINTDLPHRDLLAILIIEMWRGAEAEERVWKLLLGEGLRGDETALAVGVQLLDSIEEALRSWIDDLFPELANDADATILIIMGQLYTFFMERLFRPGIEQSTITKRAFSIAEIVFAAKEI